MSKGKKIGEFSESHLLNVARDVVAKKTEGSVVLDPEAEARIPRFSTKELTIGSELGHGGFCVVSEITQITLQKDAESSADGKKHDDEHYIHNIVQDRAFMAGHCIRQGKDCRYAIKRIKKSSWDTPHLFINSVVDLAVEARFLSVIRHPNIIKMRAFEENEPYHSGFFIVLDRLYDIMPQRLKKWKKQKGGGLKRLFDVKGKKAAAFWVERLTVAYDISCALSYLHGMSIIYRDLKPENIGFDVRGDVKIFDFGLAREVNEKDQLDDGTYKLTGDTGSLRYMAPEVFASQPYNATADTYSFAILCWQLLALETPYDGYTAKMIEKNVLKGGTRPRIDEKWNLEIVNLLRQSFGVFSKRPSMNDVCEVLRGLINSLSDEAIEDILDASRKSKLSVS